MEMESDDEEIISQYVPAESRNLKRTANHKGAENGPQSKKLNLVNDEGETTNNVNKRKLTNEDSEPTNQDIVAALTSGLNTIESKSVCKKLSIGMVPGKPKYIRAEELGLTKKRITRLQTVQECLLTMADNKPTQETVPSKDTRPSFTRDVRPAADLVLRAPDWLTVEDFKMSDGERCTSQPFLSRRLEQMARQETEVRVRPLRLPFLEERIPADDRAAFITRVFSYWEDIISELKKHHAQPLGSKTVEFARPIIGKHAFLTMPRETVDADGDDFVDRPPTYLRKALASNTPENLHNTTLYSASTPSRPVVLSPLENVSIPEAHATPIRVIRAAPLTARERIQELHDNSIFQVESPQWSDKSDGPSTSSGIRRPWMYKPTASAYATRKQNHTAIESATGTQKMASCPLCHKEMPVDVIEKHANDCLDSCV